MDTNYLPTQHGKEAMSRVGSMAIMQAQPMEVCPMYENQYLSAKEIARKSLRLASVHDRPGMVDARDCLRRPDGSKEERAEWPGVYFISDWAVALEW